MGTPLVATLDTLDTHKVYADLMREECEYVCMYVCMGSGKSGCCRLYPEYDKAKPNTNTNTSMRP